MFRLLGFLLFIVVLVALSLGWHPMATVKQLMFGEHESYTVRQDEFNWETEYLRKRAMEESNRTRSGPERQVETPHVDPPYSRMPSPAKEPPPLQKSATPAAAPSKEISEGSGLPAAERKLMRTPEGRLMQDVFQSDIPTLPAAPNKGRK